MSNPNIKMDQITSRRINKGDKINVIECGKLYEKLEGSNEKDFRINMNRLLESSIKNNYSFYAIKALDYNLTTYEDVRKIATSLLIKESDLNTAKKQILAMESSSEKDFLLEMVDIYENCDRIYNNHQKLKKTFSMDFNRNISLEDRVFKICEMVDIYELKPHIKVGICIDEVAYDAYLNSYSYNEQDSLDFITSYFLSQSNLTSEDINIKIPRTIKENKSISNEALNKIKYLFEEDRDETLKVGDFNIVLESGESDKIKKLINNYKLESDKDDNKFKAVLRNIFTQDPNHIVDETPDILKFVRSFLVLGAFAINPIAGIGTLLVNGYLHFTLRQEQLNGVISYFKAEISKMEDKMYDTTDEKKEQRLKDYIKELEDAVKKFEDKRNLVYSDKAQYELESTNVYNESDDISNILTKFTLDLDKAKSLTSQIGFDESRIVNLNINESFDKDNYRNYLNNKNRLQVSLGSYLIETNNNNLMLEICKRLQTIGKGINTALKAQNCSLKTGYLITPETVDMFVESNDIFLTDINESDLEDEIYCRSEADMQKLAVMNYYIENLEKLSSDNIINIIENSVNNAYKLSYEEAKLFIESAAYSNIDKQDIKPFLDVCLEDINLSTYEAYSLKSTFDNIPFHNTDIGIMTEALSLMSYIIEEDKDENKVEDSDTKKDVAKKDDDDEKQTLDKTTKNNKIFKSDKKALNTDSIKKSLDKIKVKLKESPKKAKELSRDLDNAVNSFSKTISIYKNATSQSERDKLVNGSMSMSISKIIKMGTVLTLSGAIMGSMVVPILAVGIGVVLSKGTPKSRTKLVDKIDIELKILKREIKQLEDSSDKVSNRKYKKLLSYEKDLQRQRQKLVYVDPNKLTNKKRFVASTKGLGKGDED